MVAPRRHLGSLGELTDAEALEIHRLGVAAVDARTRLLVPEGSTSVNLGRVAGAGIADHVHLHVVPRWAETRTSCRYSPT